MHVAVMGEGYAGLVTGAGLSDLGLMATCVDINEGKVRQLAEGKLPIFEPGLEELVRRNTQAGRQRTDIGGRRSPRHLSSNGPRSEEHRTRLPAPPNGADLSSLEQRPEKM